MKDETPQKFSSRLPADLLKKLRDYAKAQGRDLEWVLKKAISTGLDRMAEWK